MTERVALIGLGLMGQAMTRRLIASGLRVVGFDVRREAVEVAMAAGATAAASPATALSEADVALICVTDTAAVEAVCLAPDGLVHAPHPGKVVVDLSTTDMAATRHIGAALAMAGLGFLDAPVSGGPPAAEAGQLAIMVGGDAAHLATAAPILSALGKATLMGGLGAGQATKLINQTLVLSTYCVIAEAVRLAQAYGVDAKQIPGALATGHAGSNLLPVLVPRMVDEDFAPRGFARQVLKDLEMLSAAAKTKHLAMPMASQALTLYRLLVAGGGGERDGSAIVTVYPRATMPQT
ncbi:MAG: NAD(P)-dependent oxidoreductase [Hyphomicrobiales bacterium]|nr:NAD(P)-dependent oxidoreductase [Hyphomicrobiales bacterium]